MFSKVLFFLVVAFGAGRALVTCPPSNSISPCQCLTTATSVSISTCDKKQLNDNRAEEIIGAFLQAEISPYDGNSYFTMGANVLTRVPQNLHELPLKGDIYLADNAIHSLSTNDFNFTQLVNGKIYFNNNCIVSIEPGTFDRIRSQNLDLSSNKGLRHLEEDVFKTPALNKVTFNLQFGMHT